MRTPASLVLAIGLISVVILHGCDVETNPLAPYEGHRPLILQRVTQSFTPDIQWVGGRVAAVGVNRGEQAALDSTLVWMMTSPSDDIESHVRIGDQSDRELVRSYGGTPLDSLADDEVYTFWLAGQEVLESGFAGPTASTTFADTTLHLKYVFVGRTGLSSNPGINIQMRREETLLNDRITLDWTPAVPVHRIAIRHGRTGGFTDLVWHIVSPDDNPGSITPPVVLGEAPEGAIEAIEWAGFESVPDSIANHIKYVAWMATTDWDGDRFADSAPGYISYGIFSVNFQE